MKKQLFLIGMLLIGGISSAMANGFCEETTTGTPSEMIKNKTDKILEISDTTAPTPPTINLLRTSSSTIQISLGGSTDNVGVTGYVVYKDGVSVGPTTSSTYTIKNLTPFKSYKITVKAKDAAGNLSAVSNTITFTTPGEFGNYCSIGSSNPNDVRLGNLELGGKILNYTDFTGGFKDFTSISAKLTKGMSYPLSSYFRFSESYTGYDIYFTAYIDYNQNNIFESGEKVVSSQISNDSLQDMVEYITVPTNAPSGFTRMRVIVNKISNTNVCGTNPGGQAADYLVNITSGSTAKMALTPDVKDQNPQDIKLYPNPVKDILNISNVTSEEYIIFDMTGKILLSGKLDRGTVNVSSLLKGTYMIQLGDKAKKFIKQ
ncbi:GEVED domain-containing protein [Chryseobacterium sp.]|jgi:hypothetical protein|uniref:GEVED domain-containing protein n=1 Tax=Chryseobacterium sp. TaxID=1871047 RepID=UPI00285133D2|nr:GEVED domain-containing protein [Chryseobacterium sp.]MDR3025298.1 GEVED domain-containing protein [Chryseobacterium sp.]